MEGKKDGVDWKSSVEEACGLVQKGMSIRKAAIKTGLPKSTVFDHATGKFKGWETSKGPERCLTNTEESALVGYILYMAEHGFPLTRTVIKTLCADIIKKSGRATLVNLEKGPSDKWVRKFLGRHAELSERTPHILDRARASVNQEQVDQYFGLLESTTETLNIQDKPDQIYNCDETGFSGREHGARKVIGRRGFRQPWRLHVSFSGHVTVHMSISASGRILPPMLIFDKCLPRGDFRAGVPETWQFETTKSGYINGELFLKWLTNNFIPNCGQRRPVLLTMDNHVSHLTAATIDKAKENDIHLLCFPAHSTHLLQPLDVGLFHDLKAKVGDLCTALGFTGMSTLPRQKFPKILHLALDKIPPKTPASAFTSTGMFPLNPSAVTVIPAPNVSGSASATSAVNQVGDRDGNACDQCGHSDQNQLVRLGIIPPELASVLIEPPTITKPKSKRPRLDKARLITYEDPTDTSEPEFPEPEPLSQHEENSQTTCPVCNTSTNQWKWIGCDRCNYWVHYDCLSYAARTDVDLSLLVGEQWLCQVCSEE